MLMFTIQGDAEPVHAHAELVAHICFSRGMVTVPPSDSFYSRTSVAGHTATAMIADSLRIPSGITASSTLLNERRSWFRP